MRSLNYLLFLTLPVVLMASDLHDIVKRVQSNEMIESTEYVLKSQKEGYDAIVATSLPKLTANYSYQYIGEKDRGLFDPEHTLNVEASAVLFSGFRLSEGKKAQRSRIDSTKETLAFQKERLSLNAIDLYFKMKSIQANIDARKQKEKQFENELNRLKRFYDAGSITEDRVEQVRAALAMTKYEIEFLKQNYQELGLSLESLSGDSIKEIGDGELVDKSVKSDKPSHEINSLEYDIKALSHDAKIKTAEYWPNLILKDTYTKNEFYDSNIEGLSIPATTNKIQLVASMTLYDFSAKSKERQIVQMQRQAKKSELDFKKRDNDLKKRFAQTKLQTLKAKIKASEISLDASKKSFDFIAKKQKANLVDTSVYLDAATQYYDAKSILESAGYEYQSALANYYFYNNIPLLEMIK